MESSTGQNQTTSNTSGPLKVSSHRIYKNTIRLEYGAEEICHICGDFISKYASRKIDDNTSYYEIPLGDSRYRESYPCDIAHNHVMYHMCSNECVDVFNLTLGSL